MATNGNDRPRQNPGSELAEMCLKGHLPFGLCNQIVCAPTISANLRDRWQPQFSARLNDLDFG